MIPNGVDTDRFAPSDEIRQRVRRELNLGDSFIWLAVGRLVEQKDYPNLFSALTRIPEGNWRVLIAGNGPLEARTKESGCGTRARRSCAVHWYSHEHGGPIQSLRRVRDVVAFEGLSMALLEAAATGLPTVVTDVGGNRDLVMDGTTGYVVPPADPRSLGGAMTRLMDLPEAERRELGLAARRHCVENYRFQNVGEEWVRLYRRYIDHNSPGQSQSAMTDECALNEDSSSMKILYLITRSERGGAQIHLLDVLKNLPSGCRPIVATGEDGYLVEEARQLGIPVHHIPHLRQPISPANDFLAFREIRSLIKRESPDLVHAHTSKAGLLGRLAGWLTGTPTVFTAHTWSFADGISSLQRRISIPFERFAGRIGGKVITVSRANEEIARREKITDAREPADNLERYPRYRVTSDSGVRRNSDDRHGRAVCGSKRPDVTRSGAIGVSTNRGGFVS